MKAIADYNEVLDRGYNVDYSRHMDINNALIAFSALSQETRLSVLKLLLEYGTQGLPAGDISKKLRVPHNTLSFHLMQLHHAGLVSPHKAGRSVIYSANVNAIEGLIDYLKDSCCVQDATNAQCTLAVVKQKKSKKKPSCC